MQGTGESAVSVKGKSIAVIDPCDVCPLINGQANGRCNGPTSAAAPIHPEHSRAVTGEFESVTVLLAYTLPRLLDDRRGNRIPRKPWIDPSLDGQASGGVEAGGVGHVHVFAGTIKVEGLADSTGDEAEAIQE